MSYLRRLDGGERTRVARSLRDGLPAHVIHMTWRGDVAYRRDGEVTTAVFLLPVRSELLVFTGQATRNPKDSENGLVGKAIAFRRAMDQVRRYWRARYLGE